MPAIKLEMTFTDVEELLAFFGKSDTPPVTEAVEEQPAKADEAENPTVALQPLQTIQKTVVPIEETRVVDTDDDAIDYEKDIVPKLHELLDKKGKEASKIMRTLFTEFGVDHGAELSPDQYGPFLKALEKVA